MHNLVITNSETFVSEATNTFWMQFFVIIGLSMIPTSAVVFIVKEREMNCKHQQFIAGVSLTSYWGSNFLWDYLKYAMTAASVMAILSWQAPS